MMRRRRSQIMATSWLGGWKRVWKNTVVFVNEDVLGIAKMASSAANLEEVGDSGVGQTPDAANAEEAEELAPPGELVSVDFPTFLSSIGIKEAGSVGRRPDFSS
jgi:hypothetical protein